jgi:hypothetical protein
METKPNATIQPIFALPKYIYAVTIVESAQPTGTKNGDIKNKSRLRKR